MNTCVNFYVNRRVYVTARFLARQNVFQPSQHKSQAQGADKLMFIFSLDEIIHQCRAVGLRTFLAVS